MAEMAASYFSEDLQGIPRYLGTEMLHNMARASKMVATALISSCKILETFYLTGIMGTVLPDYGCFCYILTERVAHGGVRKENIRLFESKVYFLDFRFSCKLTKSSQRKDICPSAEFVRTPEDLYKFDLKATQELKD